MNTSLVRATPQLLVGVCSMKALLCPGVTITDGTTGMAVGPLFGLVAVPVQNSCHCSASVSDPFHGPSVCKEQRRLSRSHWCHVQIAHRPAQTLENPHGEIGVRYTLLTHSHTPPTLWTHAVTLLSQPLIVNWVMRMARCDDAATLKMQP